MGGVGGSKTVSVRLRQDQIEKARQCPQAIALLNTWLEWSSSPKSKGRWTGTPETVLDWSLTFFSSPSEQYREAIQQLDCVGAIRDWRDWLEAAGKPAKGKAGFPGRWKQAFQKWILKQLDYGYNLTMEAQSQHKQRRGSWTGTSTVYGTNPPNSKEAEDAFAELETIALH